MQKAAGFHGKTEQTPPDVSNMGPHMALVHFHYFSFPILLLLFIQSLFIFIRIIPMIA
jgi:hypothetical protein